MTTNHIYKIVWDIGHDSDAFPMEYATEEEAQAEADAIFAENVAQGAWDDECEVEVIAVEADADETPSHRIEGTLAHFDRFVAGDR